MTVIAKDSNDPNKTVFTILSHADPGGGLPPWVSFVCLFSIVSSTHFCFIFYTVTVTHFDNEF